MKKLIISTLLIIIHATAQNFLEGIKAEDIVFDRFADVSAGDTIGLCNFSKFFYNTQNIAGSPIDNLRAEVRTKDGFEDGIYIIDSTGNHVVHIDTRGVMPKW